MRKKQVVDAQELTRFTDVISEFLNRGVSIQIEIRPLKKEQLYTIRCPNCAWSGQYSTHEGAKRALRTHQRLHCTGPKKPTVKAPKNEGEKASIEWINDIHKRGENDQDQE